MDKIEPYIGKRTLIIGDVKTGKTGRSMEILRLFLSSDYAKKITILDMGTDPVQGIGGKMQPPPGEAVLYLTDTISAPRLMGKDAGHTLALAEQTARTLE